VVNKHCFYLKEEQKLVLGLQEIIQELPGLISSAKTPMVRLACYRCYEIMITYVS